MTDAEAILRKLLAEGVIVVEPGFGGTPPVPDRYLSSVRPGAWWNWVDLTDPESEYLRAL